MINLVKKIERATSDTVFYRGQQRQIIIVLEPPCIVGFRLKGCKHIYKFSAAGIWWMGVKTQGNNLYENQKNKKKKGKG